SHQPSPHGRRRTVRRSASQQVHRKRSADPKLLADLTERQAATIGGFDLLPVDDDLRPPQLLALPLRPPQSRDNPLRQAGVLLLRDGREDRNNSLFKRPDRTP